MPEKTLPNDIPDTSSNRSPERAKLRIHASVPFIIVICILIYAGINAWVFFYGTALFSSFPLLRNSVRTISVIKEQGGVGFDKLVSISPTPTPRPIYPLPTGKQEWSFQYGPAMRGPKIYTATIDPFTPKKDEPQTVTIIIIHDSPVTNAKATLVTDKASKTESFKLVSGSPTDGTWSLTWKTSEPYDYVYRIDLSLESSTGNWNGTMAFR